MSRRQCRNYFCWKWRWSFAPDCCFFVLPSLVYHLFVLPSCVLHLPSLRLLPPSLMLTLGAWLSVHHSQSISRCIILGTLFCDPQSINLLPQSSLLGAWSVYRHRGTFLCTLTFVTTMVCAANYLKKYSLLQSCLWSLVNNLASSNVLIILCEHGALYNIFGRIFHVCLGSGFFRVVFRLEVWMFIKKGYVC